MHAKKTPGLVSSDLNSLQRMTSSSTGALLTALFVTPLDVVKVRLQTQQKALMSNMCYVRCNTIIDQFCPCENTGRGLPWLQRPPVLYEGTLDAFAKIVQTEGLTSLWSGLPTALVMAIPATVIYYTTYDQLRNKLFIKLENTKYVAFVPAISGSSARICAVSVISPLDIITTKLQSKRMNYGDIGKAVKDLVEYGGYFSLWRGFIPSIMRDVPFSVIYWTNYEYLKYNFGSDEPSFVFSFSAGAISGSIAAFFTVPFDVVKTHRQIEIGEREIYTETSGQQFKTCATLKKIYQQNPFALFTGIVPRIIKVAPGCAIMISTYECGKSFFRRRNDVQLRAQ